MKRVAATLLASLASLALLAPQADAAFGLEDFDVAFTNFDGSTATQAGSHPFAMTTSFRLATKSTPEGEVIDEELKSLRIKQIAGLAGNPTAVPPCSNADFLDLRQGVNSVPECSNESALGIVKVEIISENEETHLREAQPVGTSPVYNLAPPPGVAAKLGFWVQNVPVTIEAGIDEEAPNEIVASLVNISQVLEVASSEFTLWGVPGDPRHDEDRGVCTLSGHTGCSFQGARKPFLTLPRACRGPLVTSWRANSWPHPESFLFGEALIHDALGNPNGFSGCGGLGFSPTIAAEPTSRAAQSPSGLSFSLDVPNEGLTNPKEGAIANADIEKAVVTLPKGMTINPSQAEGLEVCSEADLARERVGSAPGEGCPEASNVGTVEVETPLLEEKTLSGRLFVAKPYENPVGSLIALYVVIKDPGLGVIIKQPIKVEPDPSTGQLISTTEDMPQLPFSHLRLHLREGGRAPLVSPPGCGSFQATARLYPYSGGAPVEAASDFQIVSGPDEGPCPRGPAPFHPGFSAGTLNNQAGAYSPFDMRLTRKDGEQDMSKFSFVLPPGVVPKLAGIPYCPEAGIARATSRTGPHGGEEEMSDPSCPAASQIGRTIAGAGVGSQLTYVPGRLYLAGPYHGDPISAVAITPAVAGPFDAGTVVVREALRLNPVTHVGEVDGAASDPIPHILKGIPLNVRDLRVDADKPEFTLNATSCKPALASATIWGAGTALEPQLETPATLSSRYQAAGCAALGFRPKLALKLKGGAKRGKFPRLRAVYTPRPGNANLAGLALRFPRSEFIEQGHFRTICTRVQFASGPGEGANCPTGSVYGHVTASTPLLSEPLSGPIYLRSSSHNLPDAVLVLHGIVDIDVVVRIDSLHGGLRATVENVPDAPVSKTIVQMQGGQKGLFVNSRNICVGKPRATAAFTGQNGKRHTTHPAMRAQCRNHSRKRRHRAH